MRDYNYPKLYTFIPVEMRNVYQCIESCVALAGNRCEVIFRCFDSNDFFFPLFWAFIDGYHDRFVIVSGLSVKREEEILYADRPIDIGCRPAAVKDQKEMFYGRST